MFFKSKSEMPASYEKYYTACCGIAEKIIENFHPDTLSHPAELTTFFSYFKSIFNGDGSYFEEDSRGRALFNAIDCEDFSQAQFMSLNIVNDLFKLPKDRHGIYIYQVLFPRGFVIANKKLGNLVSSEDPIFLSDKFSSALKMSRFFYTDLVRDYNPSSIHNKSVYLDLANRVKWFSEGTEENENLPREGSPSGLICANDLILALEKSDEDEISRITSELILALHHNPDPEKGRLVVFSFMWPKLFQAVMVASKN